MWCSVIGDYHDSFCGCDQPFAHILTCIFPIGHQDRDKTINEILKRDYRQRCLGGGTGERDGGMDAFDAAEEGGTQENTTDLTTAEDVLFAAAAVAAEKDTR